MSVTFTEAATRIDHSGLQSWKASGKPILGYSCSYVPTELFHAAGILPIRLRGIETEGMEIGDAYFGPYICSFPKCILQLAGHGKYAMLDGAVITPGCDSMRRLDECWRMAGADHPGIVPPFFYYLDVPHKTVDHRMDWFVDELVKLKAALEAHFDLSIPDSTLCESITVYNRGRGLMAELEEMRCREPVPLSGVDAFSIAVAGTVMWRNDFNEQLAQYLRNLPNKASSEHDGKKRLMLIGSISDDIELVRLMEEDGRSVVVADNLCFGARHESPEIPCDGDPLRRLATSYLTASTCPRMFGQYKARLEILKRKITAYRVDGVVMQNIRFCDLHGSENGLYERDLEKEGVPCLRLEREYGPLTDSGRLRMRIDAFLERLTE